MENSLTAIGSDRIEDVSVGDVFCAQEGGLHVVFALSLDEETRAALVHYYSLKYQKRWTRSLESFTEVVPWPQYAWLGPEEARGARFQKVRRASFLEMVEAVGLSFSP